jgi:hypothetical protein
LVKGQPEPRSRNSRVALRKSATAATATSAVTAAVSAVATTTRAAATNTIATRTDASSTNKRASVRHSPRCEIGRTRHNSGLNYPSTTHQERLSFKAAYTQLATAFSQVENIARLRRHLKGKAREAVAAAVEDVIRTLEVPFGRPDNWREYAHCRASLTTRAIYVYSP